MRKVFFLDLEETIIISWSNTTLCNLELIKSIIKQEQVKFIGIFSFAIDNDKDKERFEKVLKPFLEAQLNVEIISWPSVEEIMKDVFKFNRTHFEKFEFTSIWGKLRAFQDFCRVNFINAECVLVDDVVPNSVLSLPDEELVIRTIKVKPSLSL